MYVLSSALSNKNRAYRLQKNGALLNYIPVAYLKIKDSQQATDEAVISVDMAIGKFELAKKESLYAAQRMGLPESEVRWFIEGCEYQMTGNIYWR